jgi:predicted Zn-dependent peptidase
MLMDVQLSVLPNGLRVISSAIPRVESVTMGIWIGVGSRYETNAMAGVSHFLEHLLFKGTKRRSAKQISMAIEGRGGYLNAFTQEESTCYYARVARDQMTLALDVLTDMYLNPRMSEEDIVKERGVIVEEIMMYRDQPQQVVQELLTDALWKGHSLGRPIIGSPETLAAMDRARIDAFRCSAYIPSNTVFAFAGKVEHGECVRLVERFFGGLRGKALPPAPRVTARVRQEPLVLQGKDIEQTHLAMGVRIFGRHDKRRFALRILNTVLGENMSSRLFQVVREKHGLAYSVHSSFQLFEETGALVVSAGLDRKRTLKAVELILREIRRMKEKPVSPAEMKRARDYVVGQLRLGLESTTNQMLWVGDNMISYGKFLPPEDAIKNIQAVTAKDVQEVAESIFHEASTSIAMVAPETSDAMSRHLARLAAGL